MQTQKPAQYHSIYGHKTYGMYVLLLEGLNLFTVMTPLLFPNLYHMFLLYLAFNSVKSVGI